MNPTFALILLLTVAGLWLLVRLIETGNRQLQALVNLKADEEPEEPEGWTWEQRYEARRRRSAPGPARSSSWPAGLLEVEDVNQGEAVSGADNTSAGE